MLPPVLILVLVDVGLGPLRVVVAEAHDRLVLILVLVDVGLGRARLSLNGASCSS